MTNPVHWLHEQRIHRRRVRVLADWIAHRLPAEAKVLDVGCGDGQLAAEIGRRRPDADMQGIDILVRGETAIRVEPFDGQKIPFANHQFDAVMMIDVLHHTDSPQSLLQESARVSGDRIIIKDHYLRGFAAQRTLEFMDRVGNARHGVEIPCNYLSPSQWTEMFRHSNLSIVECVEHLGLYPPPLSWLFERRLHFLAVLEAASAG